MGKFGAKILKLLRKCPSRKSLCNRFKPGNQQDRSKGCYGLCGGAFGGFAGWKSDAALVVLWG